MVLKTIKLGEIIDSHVTLWFISAYKALNIIYRLDSESKYLRRFRNSRALSCGIRALRERY